MTEGPAQVEYAPTDDGTIEAFFEGAVIAGIEPGAHDADNSFKPDLPGFTISYGRGFERSQWCPSLEAAKAWLERKAPDLLDY